jgi:hypothetical protein
MRPALSKRAPPRVGVFVAGEPVPCVGRRDGRLPGALQRPAVGVSGRRELPSPVHSALPVSGRVVGERPSAEARQTRPDAIRGDRRDGRDRLADEGSPTMMPAGDAAAACLTRRSAPSRRWFASSDLRTAASQRTVSAGGAAGIGLRIAAHAAAFLSATMRHILSGAVVGSRCGSMALELLVVQAGPADGSARAWFLCCALFRVTAGGGPTFESRLVCASLRACYSAQAGL